MRIRSTKPEFWRSQTIGQLDWDTRLVLKALESYVDDNGVGRDQLVIFCADAFPHDLAKSSEICAKVSRSLARLSEAGLIVRYTVAGEPLVYVRRWKQWQYIDKPNKGRYPRPDGSMQYRDPVDESIGAGQGVTDPIDPEDCAKPSRNLRESSPQPPETCPQIQSEEQRNRGTEEQNDDSPTDVTHHGPPDAAADYDEPAYIETTQHRTPPQANDAARTVVRQVLGTAGYPKTIRDRLAVQVTKLAREQHPDALIREALTEWDRREDCTRPEYLPTVLGDLVKRSRAAPGNNGRPAHKLRSIAELAQRERAREQSAIEPADTPKGIA